MRVVRYENKEPRLIAEVLNINDFYDRFMKKGRVSDMNEWINKNHEEGCHLITRHSSITGDLLFLLDYK